MALSRADELLDDVGEARIEITEAVIHMGKLAEAFRLFLERMERSVKAIDSAANEQMMAVQELRGLRAEVTRTRTPKWDASKPDRRREPVYRSEETAA